MNRLKEVAKFPWGSLHAQRTDPGGLMYVSDEVGVEQVIVDMTTVDIDMLRFIVDNHDRINEVFDNLKSSFK